MHANMSKGMVLVPTQSIYRQEACATSAFVGDIDTVGLIRLMHRSPFLHLYPSFYTVDT
jgi:hypothetical protein